MVRNQLPAQVVKCAGLSHRCSFLFIYQLISKNNEQWDPRERSFHWKIWFASSIINWITGFTKAEAYERWNSLWLLAIASRCSDLLEARPPGSAASLNGSSFIGFHMSRCFGRRRSSLIYRRLGNEAPVLSDYKHISTCIRETYAHSRIIVVNKDKQRLSHDCFLFPQLFYSTFLFFFRSVKISEYFQLPWQESLAARCNL